MESIIVGQSNVDDVVLEILNTPSELGITTVLEIMTMLGTELTMQERTIKNLEEGTASTYEILEYILIEWTSRSSTVSSLDKLIYILRKCNLSDTAERIRIKFCVKLTKSVNITSSCQHDDKPSSFDCGVIKFVCSKKKQSSQIIEAKPLHHTIEINDGWMCPKHKVLSYTLSKFLCLLQIVCVSSFLLIVLYVLREPKNSS